MKMLAHYLNGNVEISLFDNGTRIMETSDNDFIFSMPTNIDLTITHHCTGGCNYCYLNCNENGRIANLNHPVLDTLGEYQELAINLNDLEIDGLIPFLEKMKNKHIFVNGTINQVHFMKHYRYLKQLCDQKLLWGIGVSLKNPSNEFIEIVQQFPNIVIHVINGLFSGKDIEALRDKHLKILILGYKNLGRGEQFYEDNYLQIQINQRYLKDILPTLSSHFDVVCFDNLSIEQLQVKNILTDEEWNKFYQGDDGSSTFYIDLVTNRFGVSSLASPDEMIEIGDKSVEEMFTIVKKLAA